MLNKISRNNNFFGGGVNAIKVLLLCLTSLLSANAVAAQATATADFAKSINNIDNLRTGGTFIQGSSTESGIVLFDITSLSIPPTATITSATLHATSKAVYGNGGTPAFGETDLKTQAEIDAITTYAAFPAVTYVDGPYLDDNDGEVQDYTVDVTSMVADSILDVNQDIVLLYKSTFGSGLQTYTYNATQVAASQHLRIVIDYTTDVIPAGTALLTPSHILMVAKGGNAASDGGKEQTFTLSNSDTTTSAVVYTSATTTFTNTAAPFSLDDSDCTGKTLYNGQSCKITLLLDPDAGLDADKAALVKVTTDVGTSVAYVSQFESLAEQAERRIPPMAYASSIKFGGVEVDRSTDLAPGSYNVRFDLEGYYSDYNVWVAIYDCTPAQISDESCGTGTPLVSKELTQTVLSGSSNYTGKSTFNVATAVSYTIPTTSKIASLKHKFTRSVAIPAYDEAGTSLIARLFYRQGIDSDVGNRPVSVIFSGAHLHEGGIDALGRKIIISQ